MCYFQPWCLRNNIDALPNKYLVKNTYPCIFACAHQMEEHSGIFDFWFFRAARMNHTIPFFCANGASGDNLEFCPETPMHQRFFAMTIKNFHSFSCGTNHYFHIFQKKSAFIINSLLHSPSHALFVILGHVVRHWTWRVEASRFVGSALVLWV